MREIILDNKENFKIFEKIDDYALLHSFLDIYDSVIGTQIRKKQLDIMKEIVMSEEEEKLFSERIFRSTSFSHSLFNKLNFSSYNIFVDKKKLEENKMLNITLKYLFKEAKNRGLDENCQLNDKTLNTPEFENFSHDIQQEYWHKINCRMTMPCESDYWNVDWER